MKLKKDELAPFSGNEIQNRYVEQWLNDILQDANEMQIPGIVTRPEHAKPINREEVDKSSLNHKGLALEDIHRLYKSLYVHSIGFFNMMKEITKKIRIGRENTRVNIWKVYQVLLEISSKTDYKMITQKMQEDNIKVINELNERVSLLVKENLVKEEKLIIESRNLSEEYNKMQQERNQFKGIQDDLFE